MNIDQIRELIQAVCDSGITELELERTGVKIRIRKEAPSSPAGSPTVTVETTGGVAPEGPGAAGTAIPEGSGVSPPAASEPDLHVIRSPMVGTFYRAAKPDADPFVQVADRVRSGQTLCIVEAMKLMNEIPSDADGEIAEIYVNNGEPVEYNQALFGIRRTG